MDLVLSRDIPKLMEQFPHEGHFKTGVTEKMNAALPPPPSVLALKGPQPTGDHYADTNPPMQTIAAPRAAAPTMVAVTPPPAAIPQLTMRPPPPLPAAAATADPWGAPTVASTPNPFGDDLVWAVSSSERVKYDEVFATLSPSGGKVGGAAVRPVLERSNLPVDALRRVWQLSDVDKDGQLDADEFALAMHLVRLQVGGKPLPATLPAEMVPPSKRAGASSGSGVAELE